MSSYAFSGGFLLGLILLFVGALICVIMWSRRRSAAERSEVSRYPQLVRLGRITLTLRYVGVCLGLTCIPLGAVFHSLVPFYGLIPVIMGCLIVICSTVGEIAMFNTAREVGVASLEPRRISDWLPTRLLIVSAVALVVFIVLIIGAWVNADPGGRSFTVTASYNGELLGSASMWPFVGSYYAVPFLLVTGIFLVLAGIGGWVVVRRPRNGADPVLAQWDDALRRRSLRGLAATTLGVLSVNVLIMAITTNTANTMWRSSTSYDGVPASQIVIDKSLFWYSWPGSAAVLWIIALASFISCVVAASIVLGGATPTRTGEEMR